MKLPVIRHIAEYIEEHSADDVSKAIDVLEHVSQVRGMKDQELDLIGELISNMSGALSVAHDIKEGVPKNDALNGFMKRVMGSIDQ